MVEFRAQIYIPTTRLKSPLDIRQDNVTDGRKRGALNPVTDSLKVTIKACIKSPIPKRYKFREGKKVLEDLKRLKTLLEKVE